MDEILNLNEGRENVVDSQSEQAESNVEAVNADTANATTGEQGETKPVQSAEENAKYAQIRREYESKLKAETERAKQEARDEYIASQGYEWNGKSIKTEAEYNQAVYEQELEQKGIDPSELRKIAEDLPEVKEARQMKRDRESMAALTEIAPEITDASQIPTEVIQQYIQGKDLADAYAVWKLKSDLASKAEEAAKAAETEAKAKANAENAKGSMGNVTGDGVANDPDFVSYDTYESNKSNSSWVKKNFDKIMKSRAKW